MEQKKALLYRLVRASWNNKKTLGIPERYAQCIGRKE